MEDKSTSTVLSVSRNAGSVRAARQTEHQDVCPVVIMEESGDALTLDGRRSPRDDDNGPGISRIDLKDCLRFVNSLNEQNSLNIQDQVNSDLEVASVLLKAESGIATSPSAGGIRQPLYTPSAGKHFSPVKQATTLTNKQRGNEVSTPSYSFINSLTVHQLAAKGEIEHLANRLEQADCKVNQADEHGFTPLIWAAAHGQITVVDFLLQKGANVMALGQERESALALAAARGDVAIVNLLLQSKADINIYDWTPFINVCAVPRIDVKPGVPSAGMLKISLSPSRRIERGADITAKTDGGLNALDLAIGLSYRVVQEVIETHIMKLLQTVKE